MPIAYYLVNGLTSNEKANILNEVLIFLNQSGIVIISATFDGASSNMGMVKSLGAKLNLDDMFLEGCFFKHPITQ